MILEASKSCGGLCSDILADSEVSVIESGYMLPMLKDPRFFRFEAWANVPRSERPEDATNILLFVHTSCLLSNIGSIEDAELVEPDQRDSRHCDMCRRRFDPYHKVFKVTDWCPMPDASIENGNPEFVLDASVEPVLLCPGCMKLILGVGDEEEGDALLNEGVQST